MQTTTTTTTTTEPLPARAREWAAVHGVDGLAAALGGALGHGLPGALLSEARPEDVPTGTSFHEVTQAVRLACRALVAWEDEPPAPCGWYRDPAAAAAGVTAADLEAAATAIERRHGGGLAATLVVLDRLDRRDHGYHAPLGLWGAGTDVPLWVARLAATLPADYLPSPGWSTGRSHETGSRRTWVCVVDGEDDALWVSVFWRGHGDDEGGEGGALVRVPHDATAPTGLFSSGVPDPGSGADVVIRTLVA